ncbi:MAG: hypothetical protein ACR2ME_09900 [Acidimicrobiia bacterium]
MPSSLTPAQRVMRARLAAHTSWANTDDPSARTAPARAAMRQRFEDQVDPDRVLSEADRARKAASAFKAHMAALSLKGLQVRQQKRAAGGDAG